MRSPKNRLLTTALALGLLVAPLVVTAADSVESPPDDGQVDAPELLYVIKVTPTLVYLDGGSSVVDMGETFLILRDSDRGEGLYEKVGEVRVIRLYDEFSIAEILAMQEGTQIDVLQRAVSESDFESMAGVAESMTPVPPEDMQMGSRPWSIHLVGGVDLQKSTDLKQLGTRVVGGDETTDVGVGLRVARVYDKQFRLNLTLRVSGEPLLLGSGDVTQLSAELDGHYLLRGPGAVGPYVGLGGGLHRLTWGAPAGEVDSAIKVGFEGVGGLEIPIGGDGWSLMLEGVYQSVLQWNDVIDASSVRVHAGIGRSL